MIRRALFLLLVGAPLLAVAQTALPPDTLVLTTGERRAGRVVAVDAQSFTVEIQAAGGQGSGQIKVPRASVAHVEFAPEATRDGLIARGTAAQLPAFAALWARLEPLVAVPRSPAARLGLRYAGLLVETKEVPRALVLLDLLEKNAWHADDRSVARQIRLRAMLAAGQEKEAVAEAREILQGAATTELQSEAKFILALASDHLLRKLLEDNPRWEEDDRVRPERHRLYHEALDAYLFPALFAGAAAEPAARGLWGAIGIYRLTGEIPQAVEAARDILTLYPATAYARPAQEFLGTLTDEARKQDFEKDARASSSNEQNERP